MKAPNISLSFTGVLALAAVGGLALLYFKRGAIGTAVAEAAQVVNPASDKNAVYQGVNAIGSSLTGDSGFSLGSWLYDKLNPDADALLTLPQASYDETERLARRYPSSGAYGL